MADLQRKLDYANKRVSFAWAKYYDMTNNRHEADWIQYNNINGWILGVREENRVADDRTVPEHIKAEMKEMANMLKKQWGCPICMEFIPNEKLVITNCGHFYCGECLESWKKIEKDKGKEKWKCCSCNRQHKLDE